MTDLERVRTWVWAAHQPGWEDTIDLIDAHLKEDREWKNQAHDDYAVLQAELAKREAAYDGALFAIETLKARLRQLIEGKGQEG